MLKPPSTTAAAGILAVMTFSLAMQRPTIAADRTTCIVPQVGSGGTVPQGSVFADQAIETKSMPWRAYIYLWKQHRAQPSHSALRRFFGLPLDDVVEAKSRPGRSAPRFLQWRSGSYQQVDTPHFTIYSQADDAQAKRIAEDLENCYWIWTQMFFPFWEGSMQVKALLKDFRAGQNLLEHLEAKQGRLAARRKLRVVLFRNLTDYQQALSKYIPGIEQYPGFYNDQEQTTFLYGSDQDDAETRRHEMVHQLFHLASLSALGKTTPGSDSRFWLVEGIAGYFESLHIKDGIATVGGWDSSRMQFARYRMLASGDLMDFQELQSDGQKSAQRRQDIARWYAHAIAQTHHFLDSGHVSQRKWLYRELADVYKIRTDIEGQLNPAPERGLQTFLKLDDADLASNPPTRNLRQLCLNGCEITAAGLQSIPACTDLQWLDLSRLPVKNNDVTRLVENPVSLTQLTLEATSIDSRIASWIEKAMSLRELDVSWTPVDDSIVDALSNTPDMETLWLTGSKVTDRSIPQIAQLQKLQSVDLQRTLVTPAGLQRLKKDRPDLDINPLQLRAPD